MTRKALGRGLGALIPEPPSPGDGLLELDLDLIDPNPYQPRTPSNRGDLEGLVESIKQSGVVQAILVRRHADRYQLIAGERRWLACQAAGLLKIPAVVRDVPDDRLLEYALIENIQRQELTAIEEAQAYKRLMQELNLTQEQLAQKVGKDRASVANTLRLLKLPATIKEWLHLGKLSMGHARALLGLESEKGQIELAKEILLSGMSVRVLEEKIKRLLSPPKIQAKPGVTTDPNMDSAADRLRHSLGTKVEIQGHSKQGRIVIHYYSAEDLNRLFDQLAR